jgi:hypothetical protein
MKPAYHSINALESPRILHTPRPVANLDFLRGAAISEAPQPPWIFDVEMGQSQPPHLLGGLIPMVSERLLTVLLKAGVDNIQAYPALLRGRDGSEWRQHSVVNVIGLLDAADLEMSAGATLAEGDYGPTLIDFRNLVLSRPRTLGIGVFRLFHSPSTLLVHDRILRAMEAQRPAEGWGFAAVEIEMSDPPASS